MSFAHENLKVYQKGLDSFAALQPLLSSWSKHNAFVDHLARASESILFNLVEATRLRQQQKKLLTLDYSLGSTFECAACVDIAVLKGLLDASVGIEEKQRLLEICRMLIGLRNSWMRPKVGEEGCIYSQGNENDRKRACFTTRRWICTKSRSVSAAGYTQPNPGKVWQRDLLGLSMPCRHALC